MKKEILLILFLYSIPAMSMHNNAARVLSFDEYEDDSYDGELIDIRPAFRAPEILWTTFDYRNTLSNEEASKGLPKPVFENNENNGPQQSSINDLNILETSLEIASIKECPQTPRIKRNINNTNNTNFASPKTPENSNKRRKN